jgi:hypothetical protein
VVAIAFLATYDLGPVEKFTLYIHGSATIVKVNGQRLLAGFLER